jgi:uncharacterized protein involved in exopolysaccharide biosynthesis
MKVYIGDMFDWQDEEAKKMWITSDSRQFTISVERTHKDGKTGEMVTNLVAEYYYTNLSALINKLVTMRVKESTAATFTELLEDIKSIRRHIENVIVI